MKKVGEAIEYIVWVESFTAVNSAHNKYKQMAVFNTLSEVGNWLEKLGICREYIGVPLQRLHLSAWTDETSMDGSFFVPGSSKGIILTAEIFDIVE